MKVLKKGVGVLLIIGVIGSFFSFLKQMKNYSFPDFLGHFVAIILVSYVAFLLLKPKKKKNLKERQASENFTHTNSERSYSEIKTETKDDISVSPPILRNNAFKDDEDLGPNYLKNDIENDHTEIKKVNPSRLKFVEYNLKFEDINYIYPIIKIPLYKTIVRSHSYAKTNRRGYKEEYFQDLIQKYFSDYFEISGEIVLNTGDFTRPYEPDIALIGHSNYNIRIDVEIDEPYAGITRQATHCKGDDFQRDNYFKNRGWIVLRFSEYQVHMQPSACLNILYRLVKKIDESISIPKLEESKIIKKEKCWLKIQAQKWERDNFRENYLNHKFQVYNNPKPKKKRDLTHLEKNEERFVKRSFKGVEDKTLEIGFNILNAHPRDRFINFYPKAHIYQVNDVNFISTSTLVSNFFPEFDSYSAASNLNINHQLYGKPVPEIIDYWKNKGELASAKGTDLHLQIEKFFLKLKYKKTEEFGLFENFIKENSDLNPYRTEWRIYDDKYNVAGTIDLITREDKGYSIYDWKRSKKILNHNGEPITGNQWQSGIGILKHIQDTSYNRYCLQQNLYKYILEKNYDLVIKDMYLVVLHPRYEDYFKLKIPCMKNEVELILNSL